MRVEPGTAVLAWEVLAWDGGWRVLRIRLQE